VKRDMLSMRSDIDMVHHVKDDLEDLRECVDRIDEQTRNRKTRLLEQVSNAASTNSPTFA
jgi:protein-tyrosine phosphatase